MRVAVVSGGSPDYLIDIVADGLIRLLGRDRVHLDYNRWDPMHSCYSQLMAGFEPDRLRFSDCKVLVGSTRVPVSVFRDLKVRVGEPTIVLDGEDWPDLSQEHLAIADIYFKREYLRGAAHPDKVRPLSFAAIPEEVNRRLHDDRDVPVIFSAGDSWDRRRAIRECVKCLGGAIGTAMTHAAYMGWLGRSKIGVSARGAGWDTYRYWETPWAGAALLSERLKIVIENDFVDGEEAVFFDDIDHMEVLARDLLADPLRLQDLAAKGQLAVETRHLSTHRAMRVLDAVEDFSRA